MQQANQKKDTIDGEDEGITSACLFKLHYRIHLDYANYIILFYSDQLEPLTAEEQEEKEQLLEEVTIKYN
jgi:hypothetical protein